MCWRKKKNPSTNPEDFFADGCVCYREIKDEEDTMKLQRDIDWLGSWAR